MKLERRSTLQIWAAPALLGLLSAAGLALGLLGDGLADAFSWAGLAIPVAVCVWTVWLRRARKSHGG